MENVASSAAHINNDQLLLLLRTAAAEWDGNLEGREIKELFELSSLAIERGGLTDPELRRALAITDTTIGLEIRTAKLFHPTTQRYEHVEQKKQALNTALYGDRLDEDGGYIPEPEDDLRDYERHLLDREPPYQEEEVELYNEAMDEARETLAYLEEVQSDGEVKEVPPELDHSEARGPLSGIHKDKSAEKLIPDVATSSDREGVGSGGNTNELSWRGNSSRLFDKEVRQVSENGKAKRGLLTQESRSRRSAMISKLRWPRSGARTMPSRDQYGLDR